MSMTEIQSGPAPVAKLRRFEQLPGPPGIPFFGNSLQVDLPRFHQQLEAWCVQYGPMFRLRLGKRRLLVLGDHELIATIFRDRPAGFSRTQRFSEVWREMGLPIGVFGAEGDDWQRQRRMVMAGFDPAHIRHYFPAMQRVAERLAQRWTRAASHGSAIDLQSDLMRFTVDTIAGLAFGAEVDTLLSDDDVIQRHLDQIFPALFKRTLAPFALWRWVRLPPTGGLEASVAHVKEAMAGFIAQARQRMADDPALRSRPGNLLEAMIAAADHGDSGIGDEQVAGNVLTMLLAGEDTTANSIAWMIEQLWRHPDALARATAEVRSVVRDAGLTLEALGRLDYVEACIHETMRLKPVAPQVGLQALRDVVIGDLQVPAGTAVLSVFRRDSVDERHVPRAGAFEPERWLAGAGAQAAASSPKRVSMPFGAGPRICPGRYLAILEMKMVMAVLLDRFEIARLDTPDGLPAVERLAITMAPVGLRMQLRAG